MTEDSISDQMYELFAEDKVNPRKPYHKPFVQELGDLRSLTLGGSPGAGDTGNSGTQMIYGSRPIIGQDGYPIFNPDGSLRKTDDPIK